jgi:hypothetical protein
LVVAGSSERIPDHDLPKSTEEICEIADIKDIYKQLQKFWKQVIISIRG